MINLDYRTDNRKWGKTGILFSDMSEYIRTLGFLSNITHYSNKSLSQKSKFHNSIRIITERNDRDGAWTEEYRILYYKDEPSLSFLPALYNARSAGVGNVTFRINSNLYISHLINTYKFIISESQNYTSNIFPPNVEKVLSTLIMILSNNDSEEVKKIFYNGYNL